MKKNNLKITEISAFEYRTKQKIPLFDVKISAGFPSPAEDYVENKLDLNEYLIKHPSATFFIRVSGDSMINAGIFSGDLLIVDRAIEPTNNKIVIAVVDGEFTVKRIKKTNGKLYLIPENPSFKPMEITPELNCEIWGVVTNVIHPV